MCIDEALRSFSVPYPQMFHSLESRDALRWRLRPAARPGAVMNDWNVRRKARGRIRRAKFRRRRQRITAASLFSLLFLSVFAIGSVKYGATRSTEIRIANQGHISYSMPPVMPMLARAEATNPDYP